MKRFITTIKNIWKIKELRNRILFTLLLLFVYRLGSFIVLPGALPKVLKSASGGGGNAQDLLGLINSFTGGAFSNASILALGIMPYITASIIVQLLGFAVPYFQRLQQREGESGRRKLNQITRLLTVAITLVQGGTYLLYVKNMDAVSPNISEGLFWITNIIVLATGTVFSMWLGERITDRGIGNGVSLLITAGIINTLPQSFIAESSKRSFGPVFIMEILLLFAVIMATILIVQGVRRIPIQFAKRMVGRGTGSIPAAGARDYIPLKLNSAGVMPIIFAQALMFLPFSVIQAVGQDSTAASSSFMQSMTEFTSVPYNIVYFILIVLFTYVYTALLVNPQQYSEYLKRQNAFIPGYKTR
jgi:preprotein translocase subunit SecY